MRFGPGLDSLLVFALRSVEVATQDPRGVGRLIDPPPDGLERVHLDDSPGGSRWEVGAVDIDVAAVARDAGDEVLLGERDPSLTGIGEGQARKSRDRPA
jgi:hypothetical protein